MRALFNQHSFAFLTLVAVLLLTGISAGYSNPLSPDANSQNIPVQFTSKTLSHDDAAQTVTATGDVELVQGGKILRADKMVYHLDTDTVEAIDNVSLLDENGDVHFADRVQLSNNMKDGFVKQLLSLLADGSRFTAQEATRENGTKITMTKATYTVCKVCEDNPHPLWQIKADRVVHDSIAQTVKYKNARMEFLGVPLIYSPIFSHPDPTLKRKSGFLRPQYGWTKTLGTHLTGGYYYDIAPDKDMTVRIEPTSLEGTLIEGEWRQRFENGKIQITGSTANSDRKEEDGRTEQGKQRAYLHVEGAYDINDNWRAGLNIAHVSDKQYLNLYNISKENVLNSQIYAERFSGRDYSRVSALNFQDLRLGIHPDQPDIFPMAEHHMLGAPKGLMGGRWQADLTAVGLNRLNNNQDVQRSAVDVAWERQDISKLGLATKTRLDARGDFFGVQNSDAARLDPAKESNSGTLRGLTTASVETSYPLVKKLERSQVVIEPVVGMSAGNHVNNTKNVPNEDSLDVQLDTTNLFDANRFPGDDRQEDGVRANYGVKTALHGDNGRYGKVFVGQSYRFAHDNIYPQGSGLEDKASDYVGQVAMGMDSNFDLSYRFQLDRNTLAAKRHEIQVGGGNDTFRLNSRYLYMGAVAGTGIPNPREQIQFDGRYNINKNWTYNAEALYDLGVDAGLRNATTGVSYGDECFTFSIQGARIVADAASGNDDTRLLLRVGFKNIGEFSAPQIQLRSNPTKPPK